MLRRSRYNILYFHITREFLLNFIVSFIFFFFIFFVNQILVLVKKILLKNVDITSMLYLVSCAIPQFLQYVIPFATLAAASMVLGDLGANNELLALRSLGFPMRKVYKVLIIISLILSLITFSISNYLMPHSQKVYKELLSSLMRDLPTFELTANSSNTINDIIMTNKNISDNKIENIIILNNSANPRQSLLAKEGSLELIDIEKFIYKLDLVNSELMLSENDINSWSYSNSEKATLFLNFSSQVPQLTSDSPSNLSNKELSVLIKERKEIQKESILSFKKDRESYKSIAASNLDKILSLQDLEDYKNSIDNNNTSLEIMGTKPPINFYYQYYVAEYHKKYVLSLACFCLTIVTFPLSFIKIKYGRLFGFGLSLLVSVAFWYILFFSQLKIFDVSFSSAYLMWLSNIVMLIFGVSLLSLKRK